MQYLSIDYIIVYAFLAISLFIGLRAGRGIKNIKEYAVGHGTYTTAILLFTFLATDIGGGMTLDAIRDAFQNGIIRTIAAFGVVMQFLVPIALIVPHIKHFKGCLTIGDVMGNLYGKYSQIITGVISTLYSLCMIGMELFMLGIISESLLNIPADWGIIIGGIIFVAYTAHGGIHAVTLTDIFQFLILFLVVPMIASIVLGECGGISAIFNQIPASKVTIVSNENFSFLLTAFIICSILPIGLVSPPLFQRMLMARKTSDLRNLCLMTAGFYPLFCTTVMLIGLGGIILFPDVQASDIMPHIFKELLPMGLRGLAIAGMLAVVMSSLDSYLHTAGLILVHDVIDPILKFKNVNINELRWARYSTFFVGLISIIIGLQATDVVKLVFFGAVRISVPLLLFPLYVGIIGLKPTKKAFYGALAITIPTLVILTSILPENQSHLAVPISFMVNAISFMVIHCISNKGLVMVLRGEKELGLKRLQFNKKTFQPKFKSYIPTPSKVMRFEF
jgi:SSS family solute:Na+ symporter